MKYTIIIPTFNESEFIEQCLVSLNNQKISSYEVIVVDDGSEDSTKKLMKRLVRQDWNFSLFFLCQDHSGPGIARNFASSQAKGGILIFVDADMTFAPNFIEAVTEPIQKGLAKGTDSQSGVLANVDNFWAKCWNLGRFAVARNYSNDYLTEITPNKKDFGGVFRAILSSEFTRVGGFETDGDYTDDASLGKKLRYKAKIVTGGKFYHWNPDTLKEVWLRAKWIGSGKNFTSSGKKKIINLVKFFPLVSIIKGLLIGRKFNYPQFALFKVIYDTSVWISIARSI